MEIQNIVNSIIESIRVSQKQNTKRRFKSILEELDEFGDIKKSIKVLKKALKSHNLDCNPQITAELEPTSWLYFSLKPALEVKEEEEEALSLTHHYFDVPDDFINYLFEFGSEEEYERFQASLDSYSPVGLFLLPLKEDFYSDVLERILSFEIVRKRQYQGDSRVGDISHLELSKFTESDQNTNESNVWGSSDIFHFNQVTMLNVILGQSATELIESERFEKKFKQLSLYANKYYSGQFFILFHCPPLQQIIKNGRLSVLDKLFENVSKKFPYVFRMQCRYENEKQVSKDVKQSIFNHFKLLLEVPSHELNLDNSLISSFSELQQVQLQSENQILLNIKPAYFKKLHWNYENDEYVYLQAFTIKTLVEQYGYSIDDIACDSVTNRKDPVQDYEITSNPDVKAKDDIIIEIETLIRKANDKNVYLSLIKTLREEGKGWPSKLKEFWLVLTGFEIARNYYQIKKTQEILMEDWKDTFHSKFKIMIMTPDYAKNILVPVNFDNVYKPELEIKIKNQFHLNREMIIKSQEPLDFKNVKGLYDEKELLKDLIKLQEENHSLGLGGILFYGLPGCGKTYLSNAFSNELKRNFFSFSPADIQSIWIGQSQKNIKDIFSQAKSKSPSLLFLDELDSIGFSRSEDQAHTDQKATINQLLLELNNLDENDILVIGATNRLHALDTALKRSGRFDLKIPIFPPNSKERADIFEYYVTLLNTELISKNRNPIEIEKVYFSYIGEESVGFTSSDVKLLVNSLRIDCLLNKPYATDKNQLIRKIKRFINEGQRTLKKEDVLTFIIECESNDSYSPKIEFLKQEWNL